MSAKLPARTGQENPSSCQETSTYGNRQRKIGAAMAGSFSKKVSIGKAGQQELAESNQVKITKPSLAPVKGWSKLSMPTLPPRSPATSASTFHSTTKQSVKGKHGSAPAEAKQVAGRKE